MKQLAFKLPDEEVKFLEWLSKITGTPMGSLYRLITLDNFKQWKIEKLLSEYKVGAIGFKKLCNLGNISLSEGMLLIEKKDIEPPISSEIDDYTEKVSNNNIKTKNKSKYKNRENLIRTYRSSN